MKAGKELAVQCPSGEGVLRRVCSADGNVMYDATLGGFNPIGGVIRGPSGRWATTWNMFFAEQKNPLKFEHDSAASAVECLILRDKKRMGR